MLACHLTCGTVGFKLLDLWQFVTQLQKTYQNTALGSDHASHLTNEGNEA